MAEAVTKNRDSADWLITQRVPLSLARNLGFVSKDKLLFGETMSGIFLICFT